MPPNCTTRAKIILVGLAPFFYRKVAVRLLLFVQIPMPCAVVDVGVFEFFQAKFSSPMVRISGKGSLLGILRGLMGMYHQRTKHARSEFRACWYSCCLSYV